MFERSNVQNKSTTLLSKSLPFQAAHIRFTTRILLRNYVGLTFSFGAVEEFADRINDTGCVVKKNTIQIPWGKPIPFDLITDMAQYCVLQAELKRG